MNDSWTCQQLDQRTGTGRTYLLVYIQFSEDFRGVQEMLILEDPMVCQVTARRGNLLLV